LAHELTHIARARQPRFVPPVTRTAHARAAGFQSEEDIARRVETRVAALVASQPTHATAPDALPVAPAAVAPLPSAADPAPDTPAEGVAVERRLSASEGGRDEWGGLPAPWEPLPDWLASDRPSQDVPVSTLPLSSAPIAMPQATPVSSWVSGGVSPTVHAAEESRMLDSPAPAAPSPAGEAAPESAPDIDWLARQVYSAIKRRLGAEARRENLL